MTQKTHEVEVFNSLEKQLNGLVELVENLQAYLQKSRSAAIPDCVYEGVSRLSLRLPDFKEQVANLDVERQNFRAIVQIGQAVNSSLDLSTVLQQVMDTIIRLTGAERGFLMLRDENGAFVIRIARNWEQESLEEADYTVSQTIIQRVIANEEALLTTNAQEDPRFNAQHSVVAYNLRSILCVPLCVKEELTGILYADNRIRSGLFTGKDLDLLTAFANQAAVAIDNARLFSSVRNTLGEVTELKNLMDNVFESIASGVLTTDVEEKILMCNRSAEMILGHSAKEMIGRDLEEVLTPYIPLLNAYLEKALRSDSETFDLQASPVLPRRGQVELRFRMTPLKDVERSTQGVAIVLDDLTETKKLEGKRRLFEKMVAPAVIEQLNPDNLQLGGQRQEISVLFADIRGFTSFSEQIAPEALVEVLNRHLAAAAEAILQETGTIDKFLGDAVMAWFNAPVLQPDHPFRAVRAALGIRKALEGLHHGLSEDNRLTFGVGIHTGDAVLGLIGTDKRMDYTAIGDCVNIAKRIQENAAPGQILITAPVYELVRDKVEASSFKPIHAKGKQSPLAVYEVKHLIR